MVVNSQTHAIMLLTVSFGKADGAESRPLSVGEWARFAVWLRDNGLNPSDLLNGSLKTLLAGWVDRSITVPRLETLMGRGSTLGLVLEKWQRAGLWVMTRSDLDYPERLKRRLRSESPPVLFGCGERRLLESQGIAIVGSRDATDDDLRFAEHLGRQAAAQGYGLVSGGARGVDQAAMMGALEGEGTTVGVLANNLLRSATSAKYRRHLLSGNLVLVSPSNPESGFDVGRAMSRNRYIYCLSDSAVVVSSTARKGGTWNGAVEAINAKWVPVWVKHDQDATSGNAQLVHHGAACLAEQPDRIDALLDVPYPTAREMALPISLPATDNAPPQLAAAPTGAKPAPPEPTVATGGYTSGEDSGRKGPDDGQLWRDVSFYDLFLVRLADLTSDTPLPAKDIAKHLEVNKGQVDVWLNRGVSDAAVQRLSKPIRYQAKKNPATQASLMIDSAPPDEQ